MPNLCSSSSNLYFLQTFSWRRSIKSFLNSITPANGARLEKYINKTYPDTEDYDDFYEILDMNYDDEIFSIVSQSISAGTEAGTYDEIIKNLKD